MKGIFYTLATYLILSALLIYASSASSAAAEREKIVSEKIAAERIFHAWNSIEKNLAGLLNISYSKKENVFSISDTIPSEGDTNSILQNYETFLRNYFVDGTFSYKFQDSSGANIDLQNIDTKITINPMNINYSWPNFGKNSAEFVSDSAGVKYVKSINMTMIVTPSIRDLGSISWSGYKACAQGTDDCLIFNLTITDGNKTWISSVDKFDLKFQAQLKVDLGPAGSPDWARASVGKIPTLINLDIQNSNTTHNSAITFNTTNFFVNYPAKLDVSSIFGRKADWLG